MKRAKNSNVFNQRLLLLLSKLKDSATIATAHTQIKSLLAEVDIDEGQAALNVLDTDNPTDRAKKEYIKVYASIIEVYGLEVMALFERLVQTLIKKAAFPN